MYDFLWHVQPLDTSLPVEISLLENTPAENSSFHPKMYAGF